VYTGPLPKRERKRGVGDEEGLVGPRRALEARGRLARGDTAGLGRIVFRDLAQRLMR